MPYTHLYTFQSLGTAPVGPYGALLNNGTKAETCQKIFKLKQSIPFCLQHWCTEFVCTEILDVCAWFTVQLIQKYNKLFGNCGQSNGIVNLKMLERCGD
jgi:hypothetical protein